MSSERRALVTPAPIVWFPRSHRCIAHRIDVVWRPPGGFETYRQHRLKCVEIIDRLVNLVQNSS
jgi:hypothetical protein